jgi:predicted transcriptional regulator
MSLHSSTARRSLDGQVALLLALKPQWSTMLLEGTKTVEFRRRGPGHAAIGLPVLLYASAPISAIVGHGMMLGCFRAAPAELWDRYADRGGIEKPDFEAYFAGVSVGEALELRCRCLQHPMTLNSLRGRYGWRPPMSWTWLTATSPLLALTPARR